MKNNNLHPIFLNTSNLHFLVVGGGYLAHQHLTRFMKTSDVFKATLVSPFFRDEVKVLAETCNANLVTEPYDAKYLTGKHIVFVATDNPEVNLQVYKDCRALDKLVSESFATTNCFSPDFYSGRIAAKGDVKIGISTAGKYPETSRRLCNFLKSIIPEKVFD